MNLAHKAVLSVVPNLISSQRWEFDTEPTVNPL